MKKESKEEKRGFVGVRILESVANRALLVDLVQNLWKPELRERICN